MIRMMTVRRWAALVCASAVSFGAHALSTINDALVISEFFDHFELIDPSGPSATELFLHPSNPNPGPRQLVLESTGTLLFTQSTFLRRYDPATGLVTDVATAPTVFGFDTIALEADGSVIADDTNNVYRINPTTGQVDPIVSGLTFFNPQGVTVAPSGDIYVVEFFDDVHKIDPVTLVRTVIPTDGVYSTPKLVEALPDGRLAIWDSPNGLFVFDPVTGTSTPVPFDPGTSAVRGTAIGTSGQFLLATNNEVFEIDLLTGASTVLSPAETFFSPFDVVQGTITIPEPASAGLLLAGLGLVGRRRRG